jgi:hypothetical protein
MGTSWNALPIYPCAAADTKNSTACSAGYAAGATLSVQQFGEGRIILNTINVLDNVDKYPAANALLMNMINYAAQTTAQFLPPLPADFDATLKEVGYRARRIRIRVKISNKKAYLMGVVCRTSL